MCKLKSAIILKDRVFIPDYNSHSKMLDELKIKDTRTNAERLFVRAELYPKNDDVFSDIDTWIFNVDQDIRPEWFVEEVDKERMITAVKEWAKEHIYVGADNIKIENVKGLYLKDCKNVEITNSTVRAYGSSTVEACGLLTVRAYDSSTVRAYDSSTVGAYDSSTVEAYDSSTVEAYGSSTVVKPSWSSFNRNNLILSVNATFKDCSAKIIYQSGGWELRSV